MEVFVGQIDIKTSWMEGRILTWEVATPITIPILVKLVGKTSGYLSTEI